MRKIHQLYFLVLVLVCSCTPSKLLYESGDYDQAIEQSVSRLAGKKKKKAKEVEALEVAFEKATSRDMNSINQWKAENQGESWVRIYNLVVKMERRQKKIEPLLPLIDENGRQANFQFVKTFGIKQEAQSKAAEYFYESGKELLVAARKGDKVAAKEAYYRLDKIKPYFSSYRDKDLLMKEAHQLGVSNILFRMENNTRAIIPRAFEEEVLHIDLRNLDALWYKFHTFDAQSQKFDYEVVMNFEAIEVSPERVTERIFTEEKQIEDGEEVVRDKDGNALKDSTGNLIKVPVKKIISAEVIETYQSKAAVLGGTLLFYDIATKRLLETQPITAEAIFEQYASSFRGDRRALSQETSRKIGNRPLPFPSDEALLLDAADVVKPVIKEKLARMEWD